MWIVGFGTLLLKSSLGNTVGDENSSKKEYIPVIVEGYKRVFNVFAEHYEASHLIHENDIEMGAANIKKAKGAVFNGVVFAADEEEVELLDRRERYYMRVKVNAQNYYTGEQLQEVYAYCANPDSKSVKNSIDLLLPKWRDVDYARRGAYGIDEKFGKMYDKTTFLADGETLLVDYYSKFIDDEKNSDR